MLEGWTTPTPAAQTGNAWDTLREFSDSCDKHQPFEIPKEIDRTPRHDDTPF
ncbi:MAG: hypothetical protein KA138_12605 [Saprospiraceae bacterium]|nr:hypothetical protein [Saprospiraceae bacterium]